MAARRHSGTAAVLLVIASAVPPALRAQQPDSLPADSLPRATLAPLTVTVTRAARRLETLPYAVTVLGDDWRRGRPAAGLDEALFGVPGVFVANRYNEALDQRVAIRGFGARSAFGVRGVRILLDGIPQTLPDGQGQLTSIELSEIDRIEVLRGPASALYGNAAGGVLSLRTRIEQPEGLEPSGRVTAGAFGFLKWRGAASLRAGRGAARLVVSRSTADGFRQHSAAERRHAALTLRHPAGARTHVTVTARLTDDPQALNPGSLTQAQMDTLPRQADPRNVDANARKLVTQAQGGIALEHEGADGRRAELALFGVRRDLLNPLTFAEITLDRWAYGARTSVTLPFSRLPATPRLTFGADVQWQRDDRVERTADGTEVTLDQFERVMELGPFLQTTVIPHARVTVVAGVRYDRVRFDVSDRFLADGDQSGSRVMDAASGTAGVSVWLADALAPYASVGTAFETPTTTELVNRPEGGGGLNPGVEPQRAVQYEIGLRGEVGGGLRYDVAAFHADVTAELIAFESAVEPGRRFFRNAGSSRHRGIEVGLDARLPAGFTLRSAYTLADHRFVDYRTEADTLDGKTIPGVPRHRVFASLGYQAPAGVWAALDVTETSTVWADDANSEAAARWRTVDLRAGWAGRLSGVRIGPFLAVRNLAGERYAGSVVVNARGGRYFEPAPGRNAIVGVEVGR